MPTNECKFGIPFPKNTFYTVQDAKIIAFIQKSNEHGTNRYRVESVFNPFFLF